MAVNLRKETLSVVPPERAYSATQWEDLEREPYAVRLGTVLHAKGRLDVSFDGERYNIESKKIGHREIDHIDTIIMGSGRLHLDIDDREQGSDIHVHTQSGKVSIVGGDNTLVVVNESGESRRIDQDLDGYTVKGVTKKNDIKQTKIVPSRGDRNRPHWNSRVIIHTESPANVEVTNEYGRSRFGWLGKIANTFGWGDDSEDGGGFDWFTFHFYYVPVVLAAAGVAVGTADKAFDLHLAEKMAHVQPGKNDNDIVKEIKKIEHEIGTEALDFEK